MGIGAPIFLSMPVRRFLSFVGMIETACSAGFVILGNHVLSSFVPLLDEKASPFRSNGALPLPLAPHTPVRLSATLSAVAFRLTHSRYDPLLALTNTFCCNQSRGHHPRELKSHAMTSYMVSLWWLEAIGRFTYRHAFGRCDVLLRAVEDGRIGSSLHDHHWNDRKNWSARHVHGEPFLVSGFVCLLKRSVQRRSFLVVGILHEELRDDLVFVHVFSFVL